MYIHVVTLKAKPEQLEACIQANVENARSAVQEVEGCLRFDVMQDNEDPNTIVLYEVFVDKAAHDDDHMHRPYLARWFETTKDMFAEPTTLHRCTNILPTNEAWR